MVNNHIGKAWCHEAQEAKRKKAGFAAQAALMTSFFKKQEPLHSTVSLPTVVTSQANENPPSLQEYQASPNPSNRPQLSPSPLSMLDNIASHLPNTIPLAVPSNSIAALTGNPEEIISNQLLEDPDDEPYEWLDKTLNGICGEYAKEKGLLPLAIWRGPMGLPGLCVTLQYFISHNLAPEVLLEMHINDLINEARQLYVITLIPPWKI